MRSSVAFTSVSTAAPEVAPRCRTWEGSVGKPEKYREIWGWNDGLVNIFLVEICCF